MFLYVLVCNYCLNILLQNNLIYEILLSCSKLFGECYYSWISLSTLCNSYYPGRGYNG